MSAEQSACLVSRPSSYCKLLSGTVWSPLETVQMGLLSWYRFSPQIKQTSAIFTIMNRSSTNMAIFNWSVYLIVRSFISFYVTSLLGIALIHVMPHRSTAIPRLSPFSRKKKLYYFFFLLIFSLYLLFVCFFARRRGDSSIFRTMSCGVRLKQPLSPFVFWSVYLGYLFCHMEKNK